MNIDNLKGQFREYARSNFFRLRFNVTAPEAPSTPSLLDQIKGAVKSFFDVPAVSRDDMIDFAVKSTSFPSVGMKDSAFEWRGFSMPNPTAPDLGEFTATFLCDSEMVVYTFFMDWMQRTVNTVNGISEPSAAIADSATIYQVKNDMTFVDAYQVILTHVYPTLIGAIELGEEEGVMEFQVTFKYTRIENKKLTADAKRAEQSILDRAKGAISSRLPF